MHRFGETRLCCPVFVQVLELGLWWQQRVPVVPLCFDLQPVVGPQRLLEEGRELPECERRPAVRDGVLEDPVPVRRDVVLSRTGCPAPVSALLQPGRELLAAPVVPWEGLSDPPGGPAGCRTGELDLSVEFTKQERLAAVVGADEERHAVLRRLHCEARIEHDLGDSEGDRHVAPRTVRTSLQERRW
jgi:hypothetical protein